MTANNDNKYDDEESQTESEEQAYLWDGLTEVIELLDGDFRRFLPSFSFPVRLRAVVVFLLVVVVFGGGLLLLGRKIFILVV